MAFLLLLCIYCKLACSCLISSYGVLRWYYSLCLVDLLDIKLSDINYFEIEILKI